jgi:hypothetical protein
MSTRHSADWWARANAAREAAGTMEAASKETMLRLAEGYERLAAQLEHDGVAAAPPPLKRGRPRKSAPGR